MSATLILVFLSALGSWALWQLFTFVRSRLASAHLLRIKGPEALSLWTGICPCDFLSDWQLKPGPVGNLKQFYARGAAEWQRQLSRQYGSIVKLNGFLGVRHHEWVYDR